jgi:hypothetical protein
METETSKVPVATLSQAWASIAPDMQRTIDEETRKAVLEGTRRFLDRVDVKALDEMRKSLELPPEALGALIEIHAKRIAESEMAKYPAPGREVLPFSTGLRVLPGQTAEITARPQRCAFRPERLFVSDSFTEYKGPWWKRLSPWYKAPQLKGASDWVVNDIKIGNRSQFAQAGDIPADMFRSTAIDSFISFETAQTAMDIKILVTYIGAHPKGQPFYASMVGTAAI